MSLMERRPGFDAFPAFRQSSILISTLQSEAIRLNDAAARPIASAKEISKNFTAGAKTGIQAAVRIQARDVPADRVEI